MRISCARGWNSRSSAATPHVRAGIIHLGCTIVRSGRGTRKTYTVNGARRSLRAFPGQHSRRDLRARRSAARRRRAGAAARLSQRRARARRPALLSRAGALPQDAATEKRAAARYGRATIAELLAVYDDTLVEAGTSLMLAREHFVARARARARERDPRRVGRDGAERLSTCVYAPNVTFEAPTAEAVAGAFDARLREVGERERARKASVAGPHRDDLRLALDGHSLGRLRLAGAAAHGGARAQGRRIRGHARAVRRGAATPARRRALRTRRGARRCVSGRRRRRTSRPL